MEDGKDHLYEIQQTIRQLSPTTRSALPAVALMAGGAPETVLQETAGLDDNSWQEVRKELEGSNLIRFEPVTHPKLGEHPDGIVILKPHPMLKKLYSDHLDESTRSQFICTVAYACKSFLETADWSSWSMAVMAAFEATARKAFDLSGKDEAVEGAIIGQALILFLHRSGYSREEINSLQQKLNELESFLPDPLELGEDEVKLQEMLNEIYEAAAASEDDPRNAIKRLTGAVEASRKLSGSFASIGQIIALKFLSELYLNYTYEPEKALISIDEADRLLDRENLEHKDRQRMDLLRLRANALLELGRYEEAGRFFDQANKIAVRERDSDSLVSIQIDLAEMLHRSGQLELAEKTYSIVTEIANDLQNKAVLELVYQKRAALAIARKDLNQARCLAEMALVLAAA